MSFNLKEIDSNKKNNNFDENEFNKQISFGNDSKKFELDCLPTCSIKKMEDDEKKRKQNLFENSKQINKKKKIECETVFELPGGYTCKTILHEQPLEVSKKIRKYMDMLYSTVYLASERENSNEIIEIIPYLIRNILIFNNFMFSTVKVYQFKDEFIEPVWYRYDIDENLLELFVFEGSVNRLCENTNKLEVIFISGLIPLHKFNPYKSVCDSNFDQDSQSISYLIALCDHAAQHIINNLHHDLNNEIIPDSSDLHHKFTKYGTTLHSMFDLKRIAKKEKEINTSTFFNNSFLDNLYQRPNFSV